MPASDLELRQLRAFVAVAEHGSVTAAARALGVAQSTTSEALAALERALSTQLFQRRGGTRGAALTRSGEALLPHARAVLAALEGLHVAVAESVSTAAGVVEIIANESISTYVLPRILTDARSRWPNTRFSVAVATCADVRQGVAGGGFDVGLFLEPRNARSRAVNATRTPASSDCDIVGAFVDLVAFASPLHPLPLATRVAVARSALIDFPVFVSDAAGDFTALIERFFRRDGLPGRRLLSTGSVEGVKQAVLIDSRAVGILPAYAVTNELASKRVVRLDVRPALPAMQIVALSSTYRERHPAVPELLDSIRQSFAVAPTGGEKSRASVSR